MILSIKPQMLAKHLLIAVLAVGTVGIGAIDDAHAGKVKKSLKLSDDAAAQLTKWGASAQGKRGVVGAAGKAAHSTGSGASKLTNAAGTAVGGATAIVGATVVGGFILNELDKAEKTQNNSINRVYRGCNGAVCNTAKDITKFLAPF